MPHSGVDLGVDLYDMETVAKDYLPTVAGAYGDVLGRLKRIEDGLAKIPTLPQQFCQDGEAAVAYGGLHVTATHVLEQTKQSLDATAVALDQAAELYAATDEAAAAELNRLTTEHGVPGPE